MEFKQHHTKQKIRKLCICCSFTVSLLLSMFLCLLSVTAFTQLHSTLSTNKIIDISIDNSFSTREKKDIIKAFKRWERATGNYIVFKYTFRDISFHEMTTWRKDDRRTIYNAINFFSWQRHVANFVAASNTALGITTDSDDIFVLDNFRPRLCMVVTHELGHILLGAYHSINPHSIMYPSVDMDYNERYITPEDARLVKLLIRRKQ